MYYVKLDEINQRCRADAAEFVGECEQRYNNLIESVAERVCESRMERPIVLLNGPSSSGKTTTARRIREAIEQKGVHSHAISMDDYYLSRSAYVVPKDENGNSDLESPLCMDLPMLSDHLAALTEGKTIAVPKYDFANRRRTEETEEIRLAPGEVAVIEGIHSLNDVITGRLSDRSTGVYMAVGTEVVMTNNQRIAPHELRFIRRAIRDKNFRNEPIPETIRMWKSVRRGEKLYIRPYIPSATYILNTYLEYEDCVLMNQLNQFAADYKDMMNDIGLGVLVQAMEAFEPLPDLNLIPQHSIMHEFIG